MTTELEIPEIIPSAELVAINATDEALFQLRDKAIELAAIGATDKASYEQIHDLTMVAVKVRTGAMKTAKRLAAPHKSKYDAIIAEGKRIADHAEAAEDIVRPIKHAWEGEQERLKELAEKAEADRIAGRINALTMLGAVYANSQYDIFGVLIDSIEVTALPDSEFRELLDSATLAYNQEQTRLAEIEAERLAEVARVAAEQEAVRQQQEAERVRLQALADENRRVAHELQVQQNEFARVQREAEQRRREAEQAEQARLKAIDDANIAQFARQQQIEEDARYQAEQAAKAKQDAIDEAARIKAEKLAIAEKNKVDKERAKRLKSDKADIKAYFGLIRGLSVPVLENAESLDLHVAFEVKLKLLIGEFIDQLDAL